jgi:ATP-dependent Lon protease
VSDDTKDDEPMLPAEQDIASTGAAADSAEPNELLKSLPRVLRYAMLSNQDESYARERLVAEITTLAPGVPLTLASWAQGAPPGGIVLARELDYLAVTKDQPDLRSISDCVRLLSLTMADLTDGSADHLRVGKALVHAYRQLSADLDIDFAAEVETLVAGWAALPSAAAVFCRYGGSFAAANAIVVGRRLATHRVDAAEEKLRRQRRELEQEKREAAARNDAGAIAATSAASAVAEDHLIVCRMDEDTMKNQKMRELITPFKAVINTALPLLPVPSLHEVRAKLLFEFPYAAAVIDFALADLVGKRTIKLRPLLLVGPAGGGKSRFARRLGETLLGLGKTLGLGETTGLGVWRVDASRSDGSVFAGTDKRWHSAEPCHPFLAVAQARNACPMVLIDEIEKAPTRSDYGRFWDCLLGFLEPETACRYPDPALQVNLDLSQVSFVATANSLDPLPSPLRDRFRVVANFPEPGPDDLDALLPAVTRDLAREQGLDARWVEPLTRFERDAIAAHWHGGSVRRLRRVVEVLLRVREKMAPRN